MVEFWRFAHSAKISAMARGKNSGEKTGLRGTLGSIVALVAFFAALLVISGIISSLIGDINSIAPGKNCSLVRTTYGIRDLDDSYTALEKAKSVNDEFGIAELEKHEAIARLSEGTPCLVLDRDFFSHFTFYRKIRILSDAHTGKALWVKKDELKLR
jgi:hypothetical protein